MKLKLAIEEGTLLAPYTTFGIGGPARYFCVVASEDQLKEAFEFVKERDLKFFILGKGSNSLFDDRGYNGLVIHNRIDFLSEEWPFIDVGSGYNFSRLGAFVSRNGYGGLEFASGIPGSVGGAVAMNAGANGRETKDALCHVRFMDLTGTVHTHLSQDIPFAYRTSPFQKEKGAVVSARFHLTRSAVAKTKQLAFIGYRKSTQPYGEKSAGCIYRNPKGGSAGSLIEQAGAKGMSVGDATVSTLHGNFIVNKGAAKASDVIELAQRVKNRVKERTGFTLEMEVKLIPYE